MRTWRGLLLLVLLLGQGAAVGCRRSRPADQGAAPDAAVAPRPPAEDGAVPGVIRPDEKRDEPPPGAVALASAPPQTVELTLPFAGIWAVLQGTDSDETHVGYAAYALDFVPAERVATALPEARRTKLTDYPCFGQPVLAPADGRVVRARDRSPDPPLHRPIPGDTGNFLILEHAPDEYTEFRHLKAGSVRVKVGAQVRRGEVIAACGNSGNAGMPHLHLGFLGSVEPIATRPVRFSRYEVYERGRWRAGSGVPASGQLVRSTVSPAPARD